MQARAWGGGEGCFSPSFMAASLTRGHGQHVAELSGCQATSSSRCCGQVSGGVRPCDPHQSPTKPPMKPPRAVPPKNCTCTRVSGVYATLHGRMDCSGPCHGEQPGSAPWCFKPPGCCCKAVHRLEHCRCLLRSQVRTRSNEPRNRGELPAERHELLTRAMSVLAAASDMPVCTAGQAVHRTRVHQRQHTTSAARPAHQ